jgi:hypothetical protein
MRVWHVCLHQRGHHAARLPCMPDQAPHLLCHCGWCYGSCDGKDDISGLLQAGLHCCICNSCACSCQEAATFTNGFVVREAPTAAYGPPAVAESAAMPPRRATQLGCNCASVVAHMVNTIFDIVGISAKDRGCSCPHHTCCGMLLQVGSKVCFQQERLIYCKGRKKDVVAVYVMGENTMTCKVGFLTHHLTVRDDVYDALYAHIGSVYSDCSTNVLKREKFWCNKECCVACVLGNCLVFAICFFRNDTSLIDCLID